MSRPRAYFDHAATSPLRASARTALLAALDATGNPSSVHSDGQRARGLLEEARSLVAGALGVHDDEIVFTGSGTESDNLALRGRAWVHGAGAHVVTSAIEHQAVRRTARWLASMGHAEVTFIAPNPRGVVSEHDVLAAIRPSATAIVSIQAVNNELGTLQPVEVIAEGCRERGVACHTDAVQALGRIPLRGLARAADLLTLSAHKAGGPPGVGVLVVRRGLKLHPALTGGEQESGLRPGTENVALIASAARAIADAVAEEPACAARLAELTRRLEAGLTGLGAELNGDARLRAPGFVNVSFRGVDGSTLQQALDLAGFATSIGSACTSGSVAPSHVLEALGATPDQARGALRFSLGASNDEREVDAVLAALPAILERMRRPSAEG